MARLYAMARLYGMARLQGFPRIPVSFILYLSLDRKVIYDYRMKSIFAEVGNVSCRVRRKSGTPRLKAGAPKLPIPDQPKTYVVYVMPKS
ncbi:MAG: hypothetical protein RIM23_23330 [Coleofasciculus sp. G3-WIS-01]|uniref:hypothetical protein n=1 Tax=Coleofasciculus sp. G3-WIS-01 TaxID=3069528 RepID=UPI0032FAFF8E